MSVPDYRHVPKKLFDTGLFHLGSEDGQAAFTDAVVATLNGLDGNFRHLKKSASQTHVHRHGEDSVVYLLPDNKALAVDFIGGAGGPNPQPGWMVGEHVYTHADAHDPDDHGIGAGSGPSTPVLVMPPPRDEALDELNWLDRYYSSPEGLQRPNGLSLSLKPDFEGVSAWYLDVYQRARMEGKSRAEARAAYVREIRHSTEWRNKHPGETP
jgi:hypothetical protein